MVPMGAWTPLSADTESPGSGGSRLAQPTITTNKKRSAYLMDVFLQDRSRSRARRGSARREEIRGALSRESGEPRPPRSLQQRAHRFVGEHASRRATAR